ncbi:hypothetical protein BB560_001216 [Smittium megazygosporum]|uniref:Glutamyl-tRNA(Gln) amidotransferase subunit B, mitochondrial n=1 Tax=Smittium megazygosporum TaxID=133381 RepID=A0A2T9ZI78_9FUNG|nr:hypothetical protein BB560_001216 [Smittium megazygosporum]
MLIPSTKYLLRPKVKTIIISSRISSFSSTATTKNTGLKYFPIIGLEIHAQLNCKQKLFSASNAKWDQKENTQISFFDLALPGSLPVLNPEALSTAARAVLSLNCTLSKVSKFVRKHYFYPDQPSGYQITQSEHPIGKNGYVELLVEDGISESKTIEISQIQLEQDTAKTIYDAIPGYGLIDFNRAGVGLIEIVTRPQIRSAQEAEIFLKKLSQILQISGASKALMEEGSLRCDVNISLSHMDENNSFIFGTRVEIKNLNSLKSVTGAIEAEIQRQTKCLMKNEQILPETRTFNPIDKTTSRSRNKESAPDYRFMPENDVPVVIIDEKWIQAVKNTIPELPDSIRSRLKSVGLSTEEVGVLLKYPESVKFFDKTIALGSDPHKAFSWISRDIFGIFNYHGKKFSSEMNITPATLNELISAVNESKLTAKMAKKILISKFEGDERRVMEIAKANNWVVVENVDDSLVDLCKTILESHAKEVQMYNEKGNKRIMGFFVSQGIEKSNGTAKPQNLAKIFAQLLNK